MKKIQLCMLLQCKITRLRKTFLSLYYQYYQKNKNKYFLCNKRNSKITFLHGFRDTKSNF